MYGRVCLLSSRRWSSLVVTHPRHCKLLESVPSLRDETPRSICPILSLPRRLRHATSLMDPRHPCIPSPSIGHGRDRCPFPKVLWRKPERNTRYPDPRYPNTVIPNLLSRHHHKPISCSPLCDGKRKVCNGETTCTLLIYLPYFRLKFNSRAQRNRESSRNRSYPGRGPPLSRSNT